MEKKKIIFRLFGFLFIFTVIFLPGYSKYQELVQKNKVLEDKIRQIEISNVRFEEEVRQLEGNPTYVEKIARDKLKVTKEGEVVYKMVEEEPGKEAQAR